MDVVYNRCLWVICLDALQMLGNYIKLVEVELWDTLMGVYPIAFIHCKGVGGIDDACFPGLHHCLVEVLNVVDRGFVDSSQVGIL